MLLLTLAIPLIMKECRNKDSISITYSKHMKISNSNCPTVENTVASSIYYLKRQLSSKKSQLIFFNIFEVTIKKKICEKSVQWSTKSLLNWGQEKATSSNSNHSSYYFSCIYVYVYTHAHGHTLTHFKSLSEKRVVFKFSHR